MIGTLESTLSSDTTSDGSTLLPGLEHHWSGAEALEETLVSGPRRASLLRSAAEHVEPPRRAAAGPECGHSDTASPAAGSQARIRQAFDACKDALDCALEWSDDTIAKANALSDFSGSLSLLWEERGHRERGFSIVLNSLQTMMLEADMDLVGTDRILALRSVVSYVAAAPSLTNADIRHVGRVLSEVGCDAFTGFRSPKH